MRPSRVSGQSSSSGHSECGSSITELTPVCLNAPRKSHEHGVQLVVIARAPVLISLHGHTKLPYEGV
jgi:hypothetical protein